MNVIMKIKEDRGSSNTVSFIFIMLFVMVLLISFVDVGIYFNVKNEMTSAAEAGARNVALYGGTEGGLRGIREGVTDAETVVRNSINEKYMSADNKIVKLDPSSGINCGVDGGTGTIAAQAGDRVWCTVKYKYMGIAGDYGILQLGGKEGRIVTVEGPAVSEVGHN